MSNPFATNSPPPVFGQPGTYEHDVPVGGAWQASHTVPLVDEEVRWGPLGGGASQVGLLIALWGPCRAAAGSGGGSRRDERQRSAAEGIRNSSPFLVSHPQDEPFTAAHLAAANEAAVPAVLAAGAPAPAPAAGGLTFTGGCCGCRPSLSRILVWVLLTVLLSS